MPFLFARSPYLATRLQISPAAAAVPDLSVTADASIPLRLAPDGSVPRPPPRRLLPTSDTPASHERRCHRRSRSSSRGHRVSTPSTVSPIEFSGAYPAHHLDPPLSPSGRSCE
ncbi:hypothetical protein VPH35_105014 [Triticum aestivum]